ncbi:MAG: hypothetical protein ACI8TQ_002492 [Planctomycetota bacterium]|jgi:hypothetical protein
MFLSILATVSLALALTSRQQGSSVVGDVIQSSLPGRHWRLFGSLLLVLVGAYALTNTEGDIVFLMVPLVIALVVHQIRPGVSDRVAGTEGVRAGWNSRAYSELDEWRLNGDHLRFRLFGQWTAVPLDLDKQGPVRDRLHEVAAARMSTINQ